MKINIQQGNEEINSIGGISLVGVLLKELKNLKNINKMSSLKTKKGIINHEEILKIFIGLFSIGKSDYADIEPLRNDAFFQDSLGLKAVPSESTLRQRGDELAEKPEVSKSVLGCNIELLKKVSDFGQEETAYAEYVPIDVDVSPQDNSGSKKEGVSRTYKKHDGYAPILAYLGTHGYMLNCEQRPGSQHSNNGAGEFLGECFDAVDELGLKNTVTRLDSAHDDDEIVKLHQDRGRHFIIKRNLRKESPEQWLAMARRVGVRHSPREGKNIFTGVVSHITPAGRKDLSPVFAVFEVTERTVDKNEQTLLLPEIEVNTFWTDLPEMPETVIELYRNHGTSEQFHSELKTDLDIERMPSGKFATNALLLRLGMLAFNILRIIGQTALKLKSFLPRRFNVQRRRLRSVMQDLIYIACKRVRHAGSIILKFGRHCPWFRIFQQLHIQFC
jgi:hypothetical protein